METHSVTSQQLLSIIVIAMVANAVLIAIALVAMRGSGARGRAAKARDLAIAGGPVPAPATTDVIALDAIAAVTASEPDAALGTSAEEPPGEGAAGDAEETPEAAGEASDATLALLDPATGLESPGAWRRALEEEIIRLARYHRPATVMLVELDGFDRLVERLGEAAGARIVLATARTLRAEARAADRCARLGRGRFGILLPETDEVRAINFVERVRAECDRWLEAGEITLRLAIGWAILDPSVSATMALQEADRRLDGERRHRTGAGA